VETHGRCPGRTVEAFIGEYASGKTEVSINRALALRLQGRRVVLLDLDTEEPVYTVRMVRPILERRGLKVVSLESHMAFGLGEAGVPVTEEMVTVLRLPGGVVIDVGYGVHGAAALNLIDGLEDEPSLTVYCVINAKRPMTSTPERIARYLEELDPCHKIVNNTNLGRETTREVILDGVEVVTEASRISGKPVAAVSVDARIAEGLGLDRMDLGAPLWRLELFMTGKPKL
jgi:hypothetical protein